MKWGLYRPTGETQYPLITSSLMDGWACSVIGTSGRLHMLATMSRAGIRAKSLSGQFESVDSSGR